MAYLGTLALSGEKITSDKGFTGSISELLNIAIKRRTTCEGRDVVHANPVEAVGVCLEGGTATIPHLSTFQGTIPNCDSDISID